MTIFRVQTTDVSDPDEPQSDTMTTTEICEEYPRLRDVIIDVDTADHFYLKIQHGAFEIIISDPMPEGSALYKGEI